MQFSKSHWVLLVHEAHLCFDILSFPLHDYKEWNTCYSLCGCMYKCVCVYAHVITRFLLFSYFWTSPSTHALYKYSLAVRLNISIAKNNQRIKWLLDCFTTESTIFPEKKCSRLLFSMLCCSVFSLVYTWGNPKSLPPTPKNGLSFRPPSYPNCLFCSKLWDTSKAADRTWVSTAKSVPLILASVFTLVKFNSYSLLMLPFIDPFSVIFLPDNNALFLRSQSMWEKGRN